MKHYETSVSDTTTWLTPLWLVNGLGTFDTDPCAYPGHPTAKKLICLPDDGLRESWEGRVWLNPPYGRGVEDWICRIAAHVRGTLLVPSRTETGWFQQAIDTAWAVLFIRRRVAFLRPDGTPVDNNTVGSVLMAYGEHDAQQLMHSAISGRYIRLRF